MVYTEQSTLNRDLLPARGVASGALRLDRYAGVVKYRGPV